MSEWTGWADLEKVLNNLRRIEELRKAEEELRLMWREDRVWMSRIDPAFLDVWDSAENQIDACIDAMELQMLGIKP